MSNSEVGGGEIVNIFSKLGVYVSQFWLNLQLRVIKSELQDINLKFWVKKVRIASLYLSILIV